MFYICLYFLRSPVKNPKRFSCRLNFVSKSIHSIDLGCPARRISSYFSSMQARKLLAPDHEYLCGFLGSVTNTYGLSIISWCQKASAYFRVCSSFSLKSLILALFLLNFYNLSVPNNLFLLQLLLYAKYTVF